MSWHGELRWQAPYFIVNFAMNWYRYRSLRNKSKYSRKNLDWGPLERKHCISARFMLYVCIFFFLFLNHEWTIWHVLHLDNTTFLSHLWIKCLVCTVDGLVSSITLHRIIKKSQLSNINNTFILFKFRSIINCYMIKIWLVQ